VTLRGDGALVSGKLLPAQMIGGAPRMVYGSSDVVGRVNALSRAVFGGSALLVGANDALRAG
jgi:hypothetical protein